MVILIKLVKQENIKVTDFTDGLSMWRTNYNRSVNYRYS